MATKACKTIDGREVRRFLFGRWMLLVQAYELKVVEAFDKDHAVRRLTAKYPHTMARDWDYMDELNPEHFISQRMGETLLLDPSGAN